MSNKAADNMSSSVEQPTTNLSPDMPNDPVVQSNKDLALNEHPDGAAVESKSNDVQQATTPLVAVGTSSETVQAKTQLFLDELTEGVSGTVVVMVCRSWDVHAVTGRYLSTDFVLSDAKGNAIHCTAKANIAHNFLKLKEGSVYLIRDFVVHPNKDEYRIFRDHAVILEFDGATSARKTSVTGGGFVRYPFELQDLGNIELTNNKYLIDVVGYVTNTPVNAGDTVGGLGDTLVEKKMKNLGLYPVVLTAMNVKQYNRALAHVTVNVDHSQPKDGTLENLLIWSRNRKNDVRLFRFAVTPRHYVLMVWNYPSCGGSKCKKGIERKAGSFWCDSCNKLVEYPVLRFRLELDISDETASTVVVMFDDIAIELVKCSADSIVQPEDEVDVHAILPRALQNVIRTTHILELKSHTYYEHGTFESFTCWRIVPEEAVEESAC
ncbi:reverse transcriptase domain-containing protein, partial [Tanacetum coccineum]